MLSEATKERFVKDLRKRFPDEEHLGVEELETIAEIASKHFEKGGAGEQDCETCGGTGEQEGYDVEPECCGNTTSSGECRGDCAVPREVPKVEPCESCGGTGKKPHPQLVSDRLAKLKAALDDRALHAEAESEREAYEVAVELTREAAEDLQSPQLVSDEAADPLSEVREEVASKAEGAFDLYQKAVKAKDRDGQVVHGCYRDAFGEVLAILDSASPQLVSVSLEGGHRVEITFDGDHHLGPMLRLLHPETGCDPGEDGKPGTCWLDGWLENADEPEGMLRGKVVAPVTAELDGDQPRFTFASRNQPVPGDGNSSGEVGDKVSIPREVAIRYLQGEAGWSDYHFLKSALNQNGGEK